MRRLIAEIRQEVGITCSVGIGPNKLVAKVASDAEKPAGFVVLTRAEACARFAAERPGLIPGIGPKTAARLQEMGLRCLADVAGAPEQSLVERFGPNLGRDLARRARFEHDGTVSAERKVVSESRERTFDVDVADPGELRAALSRMSVELSQSLARHGRSGRTIGIKIRLDDFTTVTRAHTVAEPTNDVELIDEHAQRLLAEYAPARPVRLLGVRVAGLTGSTSLRPAAGASELDSRSQLTLPV